jgi:alanine or glycine:cation symporter, AGCS family
LNIILNTRIITFPRGLLNGMVPKFGEAALGVKYRKVNADGTIQGGAMYYIEIGLGKKWKPHAVAFAFMTGIAALGIGNMVQANAMANAFVV